MSTERPAETAQTWGTSSDVKVRYGLDRSILRRWVRQGLLVPSNVPGSWPRYEFAAIERILRSHQRGPSGGE